MDFHCIEVFLNLPALRIIKQVVSPQQLTLHLERRDTAIVCCRSILGRPPQEPGSGRGIDFRGQGLEGSPPSWISAASAGETKKNSLFIVKILVFWGENMT
jgi:hypothetical protein